MPNIFSAPSVDRSMPRLTHLRSFLVIAGVLFLSLATMGSADQLELTSQDAQGFSDGLGHSLAIDGDLVALGAPFYDEVFSINTGGVFLFQRSAQDPQTWNEVAKLLAGDGQEGDRFGYAVDIDGEVIAIGASEDTLPLVNQGAVYIFRPDAQNPGQWLEMAKFSGKGIDSRDNFGSAVDLDGETLAAGAPGESTFNDSAVYMFERLPGPTETWQQVARITPPATHPEDSNFGFDLALDGDTLAVAATARPIPQDLIGVVFIYSRNEGGANNWGLVKTLQPTVTPETNDFFATSIALSGDVVLVGAVGYKTSPDIEPGGVFVFRRDLGGTNNWGQETIIVSPNGQDIDRFGSSLSFDGTLVAVGTIADDTAGLNAGSVALFDATFPHPWAFVSELVPLELEDDDRGFGTQVAIDDGVVIVYADDEPFQRNYVNYNLHLPTQDINALFVNGFESGDTSVWATSLP